MSYTSQYTGAQIDEAVKTYTDGTVDKSITINNGYHLYKKTTATTCAPYVSVTVSGTTLIFNT